MSKGSLGISKEYLGISRDKGTQDYDVTVLEASGEFGGISRTVRHGGNRMDIGGHRFSL